MRGAPRVICSLKILQFWSERETVCSAFFLSFSFFCRTISRISIYRGAFQHVQKLTVIVRVYLVFSSSFA